jgi:hypothetical protein
MAVLEILVMQLQRFAKTAPFCGSSKECAEGKASAPAKLNLSQVTYVCEISEPPKVRPWALVCPWSVLGRPKIES